MLLAERFENMGEKVFLMEDKLETQQSIEKILRRDCNLQVKIVASGDEAYSIAAKEKEINFILDVDMGKGREQEGLDALQKIKMANPKSFVCIYSAHPKNKRLARNLNADHFILKSDNLEQNLNEIRNEILKSRLKQCRAIEEEIISQLMQNENLDPNVVAYETLIADKEKIEKFHGQYVAFISGQYIDSDIDKDALLQRLQQNFPDQSCFFKQLKKEENIIDIPFYDIV